MTEQGREHPEERSYFGVVHAFYTNMGGFTFHDDNNSTMDVLKFETLVYIMTHFPDIITNTQEEAILDRAESAAWTNSS